MHRLRQLLKDQRDRARELLLAALARVVGHPTNASGNNRSTR